MTHFRSIVVLLVTMSLAGCATQTGTSPAQPPFSEAPPSPQSSVEPFFAEKGLASYYEASQNGSKTANGDTFDRFSFTAAHRTLAFGTVVRVTDTASGRSVKVSINDRGPNVKNRIIDLSYAAALALGMKKNGIVRVRLEAFREDQVQG